MDRPSAPDAALSAHLARLESGIEALEAQIASVRELVVRAYEGTHAAAAGLLRTRRSAHYQSAYAADPLVTARIGAFKGGVSLFERAIASVQRQTYSNWELIVVCDGPDTDTAERIASLDDPRIRCVQRPRNGPYPNTQRDRWLVAGSHPFNEALAHAGGSWIAPLDQDDEWTDDHLSVLLEAAQSTRAEVCYGPARVLIDGETETYFGTWPPVQGDFGFQAAIHHAGLTGFLYDANAYLVGEAADWNLARRMLEAGVRFQFVEQIVTTYHVDGASPTSEWWRGRAEERGRFSAN